MKGRIAGAQSAEQSGNHNAQSKELSALRAACRKQGGRAWGAPRHEQEAGEGPRKLIFYFLKPRPAKNRDFAAPGRPDCGKGDYRNETDLCDCPK
ncbi:hypothetical protein GCWU000341_02492 [Oribacterium sp. oral taxon 078 str. F0262]|nr:hypothetical protein GCWU000341_02492 [Oribacterium sp. oral taxon 078 str. F0262]